MTLFWASPQAAGCILIVAAHRHIRISIHPPREGWDRPLCLLFLKLSRFQSTHPVRGGTYPAAGWVRPWSNFNPPTP